ncbi:MAG: hypothetical protein HY735_31910 [Verrucomicrobia bacterium]|nr:hypothetical protein [Verrucomicrobiota bacterium]
MNDPQVNEKAFLQRASDWPDCPQLSDLSAVTLREITRSEGVDFATALFYDRLRRSALHAPFIERIQSAGVRAGDGGLLPATLVIVPGALYRERPEMGGDGHLVRELAERMGCRCELIPIGSTHGVEANARIVRQWLAACRESAIVLVSLCKGSADVKLALAAPDAAAVFRRVVAWVNVCGTVDGSLAADWVCESGVRAAIFRGLYWWRGRDFRFIESMRHDVGPLASPLRLPDGMRMVSILGFPLRNHLSTRFARFSHGVISRHGPNDGTVLLADALRWPSLVYPVWGADHYLRPENRARELIAAVLEYLSEELSAASEPAPLLADRLS